MRCQMNSSKQEAMKKQEQARCERQFSSFQSALVRVKSEHTKLYDQFFSGVDSELKEDIQISDHYHSFEQNNIKYDKFAAHSKFRLSLISQSINSEVVVLQASWGKFSINIKILNVEGTSQFHQCEHASGSFASVYFTQFFKEKFMIKCIAFKQLRFDFQAKVMALKQYFLLKIASALQIGPAIRNQLGFDLFFYQDCIEFAIEVCTQIDEITDQKSKDLKKSLYLLHKLQIVHLDIKPENIMHSPTFRKPVFIDFGLSEILQEEVGLKSSFSFRGTLDICSSEMQRAFESRNPELIDLYYNDATCLQKSITIMTATEPNCNPQLSYSGTSKFVISDQLTRKNILFLIKSLLYFHQMKRLSEIFEQNYQYIHLNLMTEILQFLSEIPENAKLQTFYHKYLKTYESEGIKYLKISQEYDGPLINFKNNHHILQKKIKNKQKYLDLMISMDIYENSLFNKATLYNFLTDKYTLFMTKMTYFCFLMEYISFSRNVYSVTMMERFQVCDYINRKLNLIEYSCPINYLSCVKQTVFSILQWSISHKNYQQFENIQTLSIKQMKNMMKQLLEHLFILDLSNEETFIHILHEFIIHPIFAKEEKLQLLLQIKQNCYWLKYKMVNKRENQYLHALFANINQWVMNQFILKQSQLNLQQQNLVTFLLQSYSDVQNQYKLNYNSTQFQDLMKKLPQSLHALMSLQIELILICSQYKEDMSFKLDRIKGKINKNYRQKSTFLHFILFQMMISFQKNHCLSFQILNIIIQNLNCHELAVSLFPYQLNNLPNQKSLIGILSHIHLLLIQINQYNFSFYHDNLCNKLTELASYKINCPSKFKLEFNHQQKNILEIILILLDEKKHIISLDKCFNFKKINQQHSCLNFQQFSSVISIKKYENCLKDIKYNIFEQIEGIKNRIERQDCQYCKFIFKNFYVLLKQYESINNSDRFSREEQIQFVNNYLLIDSQNKNVTYAQADDYCMLNYFYLALFCIGKEQVQHQYRGISRLYLYFKKSDCLSFYFCNQANDAQLILHTLSVIHTYNPLQELARLMSSLAKEISTVYKYSESSQIYLLTYFSVFLCSRQGKIDFEILFSLLDANDYNIIYYSASLVHIKDQISRNKLIVKIAQLMSKLKKTLSWFIERILYEFQYFNEDKKSCFRKKSFLKMKIVKMYQLLSVPPDKYKNTIKKSSYYADRLKKKCHTYGGPYCSSMNHSVYLSLSIKQK